MQQACVLESKLHLTRTKPCWLRHQALLQPATSTSVRRTLEVLCMAEECKQNSHRVVGMGSCGLDYLAQVRFPKPDEKLRTSRLETMGGGNAGNAMTAVARLGVTAALVTKIGSDGVSEQILAEFARDGVDTRHVMRAEGHPSPFTYIIVDKQGGSRTCIHTPGQPLEPHELPQQACRDIVAGAALVYFDGRLTEAALSLAQAAREAGVPVLVEAERLRPCLEQLLALADYVCTSGHYPQDWTGESEVSLAMAAMLQRLPRARWLLTTLGTRGSILLERQQDGRGPPAQQDAAPQVMQALEVAARLRDDEGADAAGKERFSVASMSPGLPVAVGDLQLLSFPVSQQSDTAKRAAQAAAEDAAAANADGQHAADYRAQAGSAAASSLVVRVMVASAANLSKGEVEDTTGAGDAFIGSMLVGLVSGKSLASCMRLAASVAAIKCRALGARPGLPWRKDLTGFDDST